MYPKYYYYTIVCKFSFLHFSIRIFPSVSASASASFIRRYLVRVLQTPVSRVACERQKFLLAHRRWGTFREEERLRLSYRNSILMTQNLSGIRSEALIGRRSSFIVLAIVYEWQTKDKRRQRSNVNAVNLQQNSQYLWCNGVTACVTRLVTLIVCILGVVILEGARLYQNVGSNGRVQ